eukprot:8960-Heterococcus_DN1.PRE.2
MHKQRELVGMIRFSSVYLTRLSQLETQLFDACIWLDSSNASESNGSNGSSSNSPMTPRTPKGTATTASAPGAEGLYDMLCDEMYKYLLPRMLHANDVDELCEMHSLPDAVLQDLSCKPICSSHNHRSHTRSDSRGEWSTSWPQSSSKAFHYYHYCDVARITIVSSSCEVKSRGSATHEEYSRGSVNNCRQ